MARGLTDVLAGRPIGALDVVRFNVPTFAAAGVAVGCCVVGLLALHPPFVVDVVLLVGGALAAWWLVVSIVAATWVFQLSGFSRFAWLPSVVDTPIRSWLNMTAGFDSTTRAVATALSHARGQTLDVFDPADHHDGALRRARRARPPSGPSILPGQPFPGASASIDLVLMVMSAHELPTREHRSSAFREAARLIGATGRLVVMEFVRGGPTIAAFGPGAQHFHARAEWAEVLGDSGLEVVAERNVTPFVRVFVARRAGVST